MIGDVIVASTMKKIVEKLLESDITSAELSRKTGVSESKIRKIRLGYRTLDKTIFESVEKLYEYAKEILKMKSFVSLSLNGITNYAAALEEIDFNNYKNININLFTENKQTVELPFTDFEFSMLSDDKEKFNVDVKNAMGDMEYTVGYLDGLKLNDCKKAEIVFDDAGSEIKLDLDINTINVEIEYIEDDRAEFRKIIEMIADENDEAFKALLDK